MRISDWSSDVCSSDLLVARQWRHAAQPAVRGTVIDLFQPGPQPGIEVVQAVDLGGVQFAEELVAAGAMPAFELAFALGGIGPAIDELNAQAHADTLHGLGTVGGAVIDAPFAAHAALAQGLLEHALGIGRAAWRE